MNDLPDAHDRLIDAEREVRRLAEAIRDFVHACEDEVSWLEGERNGSRSPGVREHYERRIDALVAVLDRHAPTDG